LEFELKKGEKKIENKIEKDKNPGWASDFPFRPNSEALARPINQRGAPTG
jgi:hypothetical protein